MFEEGTSLLLRAGPEAVVNLAEVNSEGSAILALLIGWQRECIAAACQLRFASVPACLWQIACASEVEDVLGFEKPDALADDIAGNNKT